MRPAAALPADVAVAAVALDDGTVGVSRVGDDTVVVETWTAG